jgi:hypothetical protein
MSEHFDREKQGETVGSPFDQRVRWSLIELGEMRDLNDRIHRIGEQLGKLANTEDCADGGRDQSAS